MNHYWPRRYRPLEHYPVAHDWKIRRLPRFMSKPSTHHRLMLCLTVEQPIAISMLHHDPAGNPVTIPKLIELTRPVNRPTKRDQGRGERLIFHAPRPLHPP